MKPLDNADQLLNALTPDQVTALRDAEFTEINDLPCYPILRGIVLYQHPHHTQEFIARIIHQAWARTQDTTPSGDAVISIRPLPPTISDKAREALDYYGSAAAVGEYRRLTALRTRDMMSDVDVSFEATNPLRELVVLLLEDNRGENIPELILKPDKMTAVLLHLRIIKVNHITPLDSIFGSASGDNSTYAITYSPIFAPMIYYSRPYRYHGFAFTPGVCRTILPCHAITASSVTSQRPLISSFVAGRRGGVAVTAALSVAYLTP